MSTSRTTYLAVCITALLLAVSARAQSPLVTIEASGVVPLTAPQIDRFEFGVAAGVGGYLRATPWLLFGGKLRAGFISDGPAPAEAGHSDPGLGTFESLSALVRLRPLADSQDARNGRGLFVEGGAGGTLTGDLMRPSIEAGLGFGIPLWGFSIAPTLRYVQVIQPKDALSDEDARLLLFGAELALLDAAPAAPPRARVVAKPPPKPKPVPKPEDADKDGVIDSKDACPSTPEDHDGFQDEDGCPDTDNDRDMLPDSIDRCPNEAEDYDAYEDEDGCPEPDNDKDGFADADDQCPLEAEVINGEQDYDGCPDEGVIEMRDDRIVLEERVLFDFERARVKSAARPVLNAIVALYKQHPEWLKIRIEGHADPRGDQSFNQELSQRRAENVSKLLVELGIPARLIESVGFGSSKPRDLRSEEGAYQRNRRVEFVVVASDPTTATPEPVKGKAP